MGVLRRGRDTAEVEGKKIKKTSDKQTSAHLSENDERKPRASATLTRMMMRMADTPEVAMTLAQLGMRLNRTGTMASAPWSNLFPSTVDRWLQDKTQSDTRLNVRWSRDRELFCLFAWSLNCAGSDELIIIIWKLALTPQ